MLLQELCLTLPGAFCPWVEGPGVHIIKQREPNGWISSIPILIDNIQHSSGNIFHVGRRTVLQVPLHALFSAPLAMESLFPFSRVLTNLDHLCRELGLQGL